MAGNQYLCTVVLIGVCILIACIIVIIISGDGPTLPLE